MGAAMAPTAVALFTNSRGRGTLVSREKICNYFYACREVCRLPKSQEEPGKAKSQRASGQHVPDFRERPNEYSKGKAHPSSDSIENPAGANHHERVRQLKRHDEAAISEL